MSFYNMLFGMNPYTDLLLAVLGVKKVDVPRFRDVYYDAEEGVITIHTRTGGGNRDDYRDENASLTRLPGYRGDSDDEGDCTYANFEFVVPDEWRSDVANLSHPFEHGIRAEFAKHLSKTLNREPTEADKAAAARDAESRAISRLDHWMANGHTFVPKDDWAMEGALKLAEANDGKLKTAWGIMPLAITVEINKVCYPGAKDPAMRKKMKRVDVNYSMRWVIDETYWKHCQDLFGSAYPVTMAKIAEDVERYRQRAKKEARA